MSRLFQDTMFHQNLLNVVSTVLKKYIPDSSIVQGMKLASTKAAYLTTYKGRRAIEIIATVVVIASTWEKCRNVQKEGSEVKIKDTDVFKERLKTTLQNEEDRIAKFRQSLSARSTFLSPNLMKSVYKKPDKNEEGARNAGTKEVLEKDSRKVPVKNKGDVAREGPVKNKEPVKNKGEKDVPSEGPVKNKGDGGKFSIPKKL